ncbi:hypothetical protein [Candidatus Methylobacter oryzae]|nr:hypothetical protein [Candidatus Methylobacter oryzae]
MSISKEIKRIARKARRYHARHKNQKPARFSPVDETNKGHALVGPGFYKV